MEYICRCCLVTKEEIEQAVKDGIRDIDELKSETMATSGCGKCKILCQHIIDEAIKRFYHCPI